MIFLYNTFANEVLQGIAGNLATYSLRALLLDSGYSPNQAHDFLDDIPVGSRVHTTNNLSNLVISNGKLLVDDYDIITLSGAQITQVVFYNHTGIESTSKLLIYDSSSLGLPFTPTGEDFTLDFGATGIIDLTRIL